MSLQGGFVLPTAPFPALHWWWAAQQPGALWDGHEHFVKQTPRNRWLMAGPRGPEWITLSVVHPRQPHAPTSRMGLSPHIPARRTWRAIQTCYGSAPYFAHLAPELEPLILSIDAGGPLEDFCVRSWQWVHAWTGWKLPEASPTYVEVGRGPAGPWDLRHKRNLLGAEWTFVPYSQVFSDRMAFVAGCSVLDALMVWGPEAGPRLTDWVRPTWAVPS